MNEQRDRARVRAQKRKKCVRVTKERQKVTLSNKGLNEELFTEEVSGIVEVI